MGLDEKEFLIAELERSRAEENRFVVSWNPVRNADGEFYLPGFPHFEIVQSGELPLRIPGSGEEDWRRLLPGHVLCLAPGYGVWRDSGTTRNLLVINLHGEGVECYHSRHRVGADGIAVSRISYFTSTPLNVAGMKVMEAFEHHSRETEEHGLLQPLFRIFLAEVRDNLRSDRTRSNDKPYFVYLTLLRHLRENCASAMSRKTAAEEFGLSPDYISHLFRQYHPVSFHEELTRLRLELAANYLRQPGLSVDSIATRCGFADPGYFIKVFRKHRGMTPGRFRLQ